MNLLCPACHTPLPAATAPVVACPACSAEIDLSRAGTAVGRPRYVPEPDRSGRVVAGYRIEARLGGGGMGTVYRALGPDGRAVAVKFLSPVLAGSAELMARFAREVAVLAGLDHPAIVRVLGQGEDQSVPWFAMELVEGEDLRARLRRGPLPREEIAPVFDRVLAALAHAHDRGVVHRDLKPANVLLAADGARLADFGVARWEAETASLGAATRLTETAAVIGTLPYMSPEQRRGGAIDRRSDLFSLGVMLYEAITGSVPQGAFPAPSAQRPEFPRAVDRLVLALLAPDPAARPASAEEVRRALAAALAPRARRRVVAVIGGAAAAVVALLGVSGARMWSGEPLASKAQEPGGVTRGVLLAPKSALPPPQVEPQAQAASLEQKPAPPANPKAKAAENDLLFWEQGKRLETKTKALAGSAATRAKKTAKKLTKPTKPVAKAASIAPKDDPKAEPFADDPPIQKAMQQAPPSKPQQAPAFKPQLQIKAPDLPSASNVYSK